MTSIPLLVTSFLGAIALALGGYAWYSESQIRLEIAAKPQTATAPKVASESKPKIDPTQRAGAEVDKLAQTQAADEVKAAKERS
jgi:hypothetical protein